MFQSAEHMNMCVKRSQCLCVSHVCVTYLIRGQWRNKRSSCHWTRTSSPPVSAPVQEGGGGGGGGRRVGQGEGQGGGEGQRAGQGGRAGPFLGALLLRLLLLLLRLLAKGEGGGDSQGEGERVRRGAAGPSAAGVRRAQGGMRDEGQREGRRQRARPGTGRVTHGLSEGLKGGSGRDLHAGLLPGGYALPPGAMI